jgi:hypothetical protein
VETKSFRLPKKTGAYADALAAVGLERLLDFLGAGRARIKDRGGYYELTFKKPVNLEALDYAAVHGDPGYRYVKLKENSPAPLNHLDYPAGRERWQSYKDLKKSLGDHPTDEQREQLRQAEPDSRWHLYQNVNVLQGFGPYNKLHEEITNSDVDGFSATLHAKLASLAAGQDAGRVKGVFKPGALTLAQAFSPHLGKGVSEPKTALPKTPPKDPSKISSKVAAKNLKTGEVMDWFDEYLKFLGLEQAANARAVGPKLKDMKMFVMVPGDITASNLSVLSRKFFQLRLPWSSTQIDVQGALGLAEGLVEQLARGDLEEFGKTPREYVSGLQTAYFKSLGSAKSLANTGFVRLPDWFHVTEENANEWLEILDEHRRVLRLLDEERNEQAELLFLYRDFLSATNVQTLLEFLAAYASHLIRVGAKADSPAKWRRNIRTFTTKNLRRLLVRSGKDPEEMKFKEIVDDPGFRAVAGAIRRATVTEQYYKSQGKQVFEIEYGLFQDFKRKARFSDQFIAALSEFVNRYHTQDARLYERKKGKPQRRWWPLAVGELDRVMELVDRHGSETVAMLLIAYGSARDPRAPDEAAESAQAQDARVEEPATGEENSG